MKVENYYNDYLDEITEGTLSDIAKIGSIGALGAGAAYFGNEYFGPEEVHPELVHHHELDKEALDTAVDKEYKTELKNYNDYQKYLKAQEKMDQNFKNILKEVRGGQSSAEDIADTHNLRKDQIMTHINAAITANQAETIKEFNSIINKLQTKGLLQNVDTEELQQQIDKVKIEISSSSDDNKAKINSINELYLKLKNLIASGNHLTTNSPEYQETLKTLKHIQELIKKDIALEHLKFTYDHNIPGKTVKGSVTDFYNQLFDKKAENVSYKNAKLNNLLATSGIIPDIDGDHKISQEELYKYLNSNDYQNYEIKLNEDLIKQSEYDDFVKNHPDLKLPSKYSEFKEKMDYYQKHDIPLQPNKEIIKDNLLKERPDNFYIDKQEHVLTPHKKFSPKEAALIGGGTGLALGALAAAGSDNSNKNEDQSQSAPIIQSPVMGQLSYQPQSMYGSYGVPYSYPQLSYQTPSSISGITNNNNVNYLNYKTQQNF